MNAPTGFDFDSVRVEVGALRTALDTEERDRVTATVQALRRALSQASVLPPHQSADRLALFSLGLRQIERAAREGDFADAGKLFSRWQQAMTAAKV